MEEFLVLRCHVVALFALGNLCFAFALVSFSPWCMGVACGVQRVDFSRRVRYLVQQWIHVYGRLWTNFSIFYVAVNSNPEAFGLHSVSVHSRYFWLQSLQRGSHVEIWTSFLQVLHFVQFVAVFCFSVQLGPSMMKSSSSSRAPCKISLSDLLHLWSFVVMHISHLNRP